MPEESSSPLSYQTTMPEYPDVSFDAYKRYFYGDNYAAMKNYVPVAVNQETYKTWRTNQIDKWNADMSAYNTWLQSGAGIRASAESGGYNPSYFDGGSSSASGINPGEVSPSGNAFSDMAQGISGIFQFASALQGIKMMSSQIAGQELKNKAQEINNQYLEGLLRGKVSALGLKNDRQQFEIEQLFYPRWSHRPELWAQGVFSPYGREVYDLRDAEKGLGYQSAVADLDYLRAGKELRKSQSALLNASERETTWYIENVQKFEAEILENQAKILAGEYDFQKTEQRLRKAGVIANIGVGVINSAVNAIKAFSAGGLLSSAGGSLSAPSWKSPLAFPENGGLDFSGFGSFSPYE